jgi:hypothetical protein
LKIRENFGGVGVGGKGRGFGQLVDEPLEAYTGQPPTPLNRPKSKLPTITKKIEKNKPIFVISGPFIVIYDLLGNFPALSKNYKFLVGLLARFFFLSF